MRVLINASAHFVLTGDGTLWTPLPAMSSAVWTRYLDVFDEVRLLARAHQRATPPDGWRPATGEGITATPLPDYVGAWGLLGSFGRMSRAIRAAVPRAEAILFRLPCHIAVQASRHLPRTRPYAVELIGDPYDVFAPGTLKHPLRPFLRWWFPRQTRALCAGAAVAGYVTKHALQRRYPPGPNAFSLDVSDVDLPEAAFSGAPRPHPRGPRVNLVFVGTLTQLYKAPDVLIDAVGLCVGAGLDLGLVLVGDGKHRPDLEARAARLGLAERVSFRGQLTTAEQVRRELDAADLFVMPSLTEGLPKAMLEAMARGLPCIGSAVGGIPELLPAEDLVAPRDAAALAAKIREVIVTPDRMAQMSARNLREARAYSDHLLRARRISFLEQLREETSRWLKARNGASSLERS